MRQARTGQRINTDSCVFGDCLHPLLENATQPSHCLDIGCGTGILAIMMAAKFPRAKVLAIEPATEIAALAQENAAASPWHDRISVEVTRLQEFTAKNGNTQFDFIACNPPFFRDSQISTDPLRAMARHDTDLPVTVVATGIMKLLSHKGTVWILCPFEKELMWVEQFKQCGLVAAKINRLQDHPDATPHATAIGFIRKSDDFAIRLESSIHQTISYREESGGAHSKWMKDYRKRWHPF